MHYFSRDRRAFLSARRVMFAMFSKVQMKKRAKRKDETGGKGVPACAFAKTTPDPGNFSENAVQKSGEDGVPISERRQTLDGDLQK